MFKISLYYNPPCPTTSSARRLHYTLLPQPGPARTYPTAKLTLQRNLPYTAPCCETYPTPQPTALQNLPYNATYPATHPAAKLTLHRNLPYIETYPTAQPPALQPKGPAPTPSPARTCPAPHLAAKLTLQPDSPKAAAPPQTYPAAKLVPQRTSALQRRRALTITKSPPNLPYNAPATTKPDRNPRAPPLDPPRRVVTGKSRRRRAYPQQIVTTRLLYCLQDPFAQLSRLQRI